MFDFNQLQALREMVVGEEEEDNEIVENHYKGSVLNPGDIGADPEKKKPQAKAFTKIEAKPGKKYEPKLETQVLQQKPKQEQRVTARPPTKSSNAIWTEEEVSELPISKHDSRKTPDFEILYRQKVGTEDVYLGLSGVGPSSEYCNQMLLRIKLPGATLKEISLDVTERAMVLQTKDYYLHQYFPYKIESKQSKAKFISDNETLELVFPVIKELNL